MNSDEPEAKEVLINPYYAITFSDDVFGDHQTIAKEDWVSVNVVALSEDTEKWLTEMLNILEHGTNDKEDLYIANPAHAVELTPNFAIEHEALIPHNLWIQANTKLITELGVETWLYLLLDVLEQN